MLIKIKDDGWSIEYVGEDGIAKELPDRFMAIVDQHICVVVTYHKSCGGGHGMPNIIKLMPTFTHVSLEGNVYNLDEKAFANGFTPLESTWMINK